MNSDKHAEQIAKAFKLMATGMVRLVEHCDKLHTSCVELEEENKKLKNKKL